MRVRLEGRQIKVFGVSGLDGRSMNGTWLNWIERGEMDSGESSGTEYLNRRLVLCQKIQDLKDEDDLAITFD